jgi:8-oxo-dGTP diphosphatase
MKVVAAAIVEKGRLLVVSKMSAPHVYYLPGGKPEAGESPEQTLTRELNEELGVSPVELDLLGQIEDIAALERVPMKMMVFAAKLTGRPQPAAELAALGWTDGRDSLGACLAPAVRNHVIPLLIRLGVL